MKKRLLERMHQNVPLKVTRFIGLALALTLTSCSDIIAQECTKCDLNALQLLSQNLDSLKYNHVKNFLCTLDSSCKNNVEYSEWSNEMVFLLIKKDVNLLNQVLHDLGWPYVRLIAAELSAPVHDDIDLIKIYNILLEAVGPKDIIVVEKSSILNAAKRNNIKIIE